MVLAAKYKQLMMLEIANWFKLTAAITLKSGVSIFQSKNCILSRSSAAVQCVKTILEAFTVPTGFGPFLSRGTADKRNTPHMLL